MEAEVQSRLISLGLEAQQLILAIQRVAQSKANSLKASLNATIDQAEEQSTLFFEYLRTKTS